MKVSISCVRISDLAKDPDEITFSADFEEEREAEGAAKMIATFRKSLKADMQKVWDDEAKEADKAAE